MIPTYLTDKQREEALRGFLFPSEPSLTFEIDYRHRGAVLFALLTAFHRLGHGTVVVLTDCSHLHEGASITNSIETVLPYAQALLEVDQQLHGPYFFAERYPGQTDFDRVQIDESGPTWWRVPTLRHAWLTKGEWFSR